MLKSQASKEHPFSSTLNNGEEAKFSLHLKGEKRFVNYLRILRVYIFFFSLSLDTEHSLTS